MELVKVALLSIGSVVILFVLTKIIGNRQMSQLSLFDYINGITIGSIAAEMATSLENNFMQPLVAMVIYALFTVLIYLLTNKSIHARRLITGKAIILYQDGILYFENLKKSKVDIDEFLMECRQSGYFDLSKLKSAIMEANGKISFLPLAQNRPVTPEDMSLAVPGESLMINVIIDGSILQQNLKMAGLNEAWLMKKLNAQGIERVEAVTLATCTDQQELQVYKRVEKAFTSDPFS